MAVLTVSGRAALAASLKERSIYLAWGSGDPSWDDNPVAEDTSRTGLYAEVGRVPALIKGFAVPDSKGEIILPSGRFRQVTEPAPHLYLRFSFDFNDSPDATIRELGVFVGTVPVKGLPEGQRYLLLDQVQDPGLLLAVEHIPAFQRSLATRQMFEFVISI